MSPADLSKLTFEIDRYLRELRGSQSAKDTMDVVKARNRMIHRLKTAIMISRVYGQKVRRLGR